jgi:hypothetical protein
MEETDYRKKYVTCEDYTESAHSPSEVDLLKAFTGVSIEPAIFIVTMRTPLDF